MLGRRTRGWQRIDGAWTPHLELPGTRGNDRSTWMIVAALLSVAALMALPLGHWVPGLLALLGAALAGWRYSQHARERIGLWPDRLELRRGPWHQVWPLDEIASLRFRFYKHEPPSYLLTDRAGRERWIPAEAGRRIFARVMKPLAARLVTAFERDGQVEIHSSRSERLQLLIAAVGGLAVGGAMLALSLAEPARAALLVPFGLLIGLFAGLAFVQLQRLGAGVVIRGEGIARLGQPQSLIRWEDLDKLVIGFQVLYVSASDLGEHFAISLRSPNAPLVPQLVRHLHPEIAIDNETQEIFLG